MKRHLGKGLGIAAFWAAALLGGQSSAWAQAQGTVPPWKPMALIASAERGPLPMVLDKEFCARQAKRHARQVQLSKIPGTPAMPPVMRQGVPGVLSEQLPPPKP